MSSNNPDLVSWIPIIFFAFGAGCVVLGLIVGAAERRRERKRFDIADNTFNGPLQIGSNNVQDISARRTPPRGPFWDGGAKGGNDAA